MNLTPSFAVVTDGCSNLPGALLKQLNIRVLPFTYFVDGQPVEYNGDVDAFDAKAYYEQIRQGKLITTSLTNAQSFYDHFRPLLEAGQDILYVGMSSGISGTYQAAVMAAQELMEEFKERCICTVDSLGAGLGVGLLACRAADMRQAGMKVKETAQALAQEVQRLCQFFTVGSLEYLRRSGRVSAATAALGSVLNIKPLLYGDYEGHIVSCGKHRGRKRVMEAIVDKFRALAEDVQNSRVFISHGDCPEDAQLLAEKVCAVAQPKELILCPHEPVTGAHVGPGMLALFFLGSKRNT